jgi:hypothetical protein
MVTNKPFTHDFCPEGRDEFAEYLARNVDKEGFAIALALLHVAAVAEELPGAIKELGYMSGLLDQDKNTFEVIGDKLGEIAEAMGLHRVNSVADAGNDIRIGLDGVADAISSLTSAVESK